MRRARENLPFGENGVANGKGGGSPGLHGTQRSGVKEGWGQPLPCAGAAPLVGPKRSAGPSSIAEAPRGRELGRSASEALVHDVAGPERRSTGRRSLRDDEDADALAVAPQATREVRRTHKKAPARTRRKGLSESAGFGGGEEPLGDGNQMIKLAIQSPPAVLVACRPEGGRVIVGKVIHVHYRRFFFGPLLKIAFGEVLEAKASLFVVVNASFSTINFVIDRTEASSNLA